MAEEIIVKKWGEVLKQLEQDGLPKEKAREVLPGAISFLCEAEAKSKGQYLPAEVVKVQKETIQYLNQIKENYPTIKGYIDYLFREERAGRFLARIQKGVAEKGEPRTIDLLYLCDEGLELDVFTEWTYLGKEKKMWRRADKEAGEVGINFRTIEAGVHFKRDFRPENREEWKPRHFLPTDWPEKDSPRGKNQIALSRYLGELAGKAEKAYEAYRATKATKKAEAVVETTPEATPEAAPAALKPTRKTTQRRTKGHEEGEKTGRPQAKARGKTRRQQAAEDATEAQA